jgi:hypothetical protein
MLSWRRHSLYVPGKGDLDVVLIHRKPQVE